MPEKINAGGLLDSLKKTFGLGPQHPTEAPAALETPAAPLPVPALELAPAIMPEPMVTETSSPVPEPAVVAPAGGLPDWLTAPSAVEPISTPTAIPDWLKDGKAAAEELWPSAPAAEAPVEVPALIPVPDAPAALSAVEAPVVDAPVLAAAVEAKVEGDPFATNREFNGYMRIIRGAQAVLANGIALNPEEKKKALIAVAKSNSLLLKLPPVVLESVLLMRAVESNNPNFNQDDFQREMLAAMDRIKTGVAVKG